MSDPRYEETLCTAHRKSGLPCKNHAMRGTNVCRMHGGSAPQVRKAAAVRILMAADKAAARLVELMQDKAVPYAVQLAAARDLLDRAQLAAKNESVVTVELAEWEKKLMGNAKPVKIVREYLPMPEGYDENGNRIGTNDAANQALEVAVWRASQGKPVGEIEAVPLDPEAAAQFEADAAASAAKAVRRRKAEELDTFNKKRGEFLEKRMAEPVKEINSYPLTPIRAKKRT